VTEPLIRWTFGALALLLVSASGALALFGARLGQKLRLELRQRLIGWWIMIAIFAVAMLSTRKVTIAFFAFISFLAFKEYVALIAIRRADRRVLFWAYLAIPVQYYLIARGWYGLFVLFVPVYVFLLLPFRMILVGETQGYVRAIATLQWGLMTMVFCLGHLAWLLVMPVAEGTTAKYSGPALVMFVICLTQLNDVAQYCWGKAIGGPKIVPTVSPNKTWAGMLGGLITTALLAWLAGPYYTPLTSMQSLVAGTIIGAGGFVGDCAMAALKRDIGVKDASDMIPGHGGVIDRVNSLIYTAPLFTHFVRFLHF
jgi:phosphatidate cytidylyltransferase